METIDTTNLFRTCVCHGIPPFRKFPVVLSLLLIRRRLLRGRRAIPNIKPNCANIMWKQACANSMATVPSPMGPMIFAMPITNQFYVAYSTWRIIVLTVRRRAARRTRCHSVCFRRELRVYSWRISSFVDHRQTGLLLRATVRSSERRSGDDGRTGTRTTFATFKLRLRLGRWTMLHLERDVLMKLEKNSKAASTVVSIAFDGNERRSAKVEFALFMREFLFLLFYVFVSLSNLCNWFLQRGSSLPEFVLLCWKCSLSRKFVQFFFSFLVHQSGNSYLLIHRKRIFIYK